MTIVTALCHIALADESEINTLLKARQYISGFGGDHKIIVWPQSTVRYELLSSIDGIANIIDSYADDRRSIVSLNGDSRLPTISIVVVNDMASDFQNVLTHSRMRRSLWSAVISTGLGTDGCNAYKQVSRQTWAGLGVVVVERKFLTLALDMCIRAGLDYLLGVPLAQTYFSVRALPPEASRVLLLSAIYHCARSGRSSPESVERTKDGLTPLPSTQCVADRLNELNTSEGVSK